MKQNIREIFKTNFNNITFLVILLCSVTNFALTLFSEKIEISESFYSIGISTSACLGGPVVGVIVAIISSMIYISLVNLNAISNCIINIIIGLVVGILARKGMLKNVFSAYITGVILTNVVVMLAYLIEIIILKDYYFEGSLAQLTMELFNDVNVSPLIAGMFAECIAKLPQCYIGVFSAYYICSFLKKNKWFDNLIKNNLEDMLDE